MLELKNEFVLCFRPIFETIVDHFNLELRLSDKDEFRVQTDKINSTQRLVNMVIECVRKGV